MAEYIDKEAVIKEQQRFLGYLDNDMLNRLEIAVKRLPIANVEERKTGKWEMKPDPYGFFDEIPVCSNCGCTTKWREKYMFCPNCGAKMTIIEAEESKDGIS